MATYLFVADNGDGYVKKLQQCISSRGSRNIVYAGEQQSVLNTIISSAQPDAIIIDEDEQLASTDRVIAMHKEDPSLPLVILAKRRLKELLGANVFVLNKDIAAEENCAAILSH